MHYIGPQKISGFRGQIPTLDNLMNKAIFINSPPTPLPEPTQQPGSTTFSRQLLLPFMNFTCNGTLVRLIFVANKHLQYYDHNAGGNVEKLTLASWPCFSLWRHHRREGYFEKMHDIGPFDPNQLTVFRAETTGVARLVEVNLTATFKEGDVLGVALGGQQSSAHGDPVSTITPSNDLKLLKEAEGYGRTLVCNNTRCSEHSVMNQEMPYIAVETSNQRCALGFLKEQSLRMIVAPRVHQDYDHRFLYFPGGSILQPAAAMSIPLTQILDQFGH